MNDPEVHEWLGNANYRDCTCKSFSGAMTRRSHPIRVVIKLFRRIVNFERSVDSIRNWIFFSPAKTAPENPEDPEIILENLLYDGVGVSFSCRIFFRDIFHEL